MIRAVVLAALLAQDAGTSYPVYTVGEDARISEGFNPAVEVPPGVYVPRDSWTHIDNEVKRLQWIEMHPVVVKEVPPEVVIVSVIVGIIVGVVAGAGAAYAATR